MKTKLILPFFLIASFYANAQNVGIGTTAPTEKLHVTGNIKADTVKPNSIKMTANAASGKVLTSDASGNASWQESTSTSTGGSDGAGYGSWGGCSMNGISQYIPVADTAAEPGDNFGNSVAISGNFAIVGAVNDQIGANANQGSAIIYQYVNGSWTIMQKLSDATGVEDDFFGSSVSISGNYAVVGASGDDETFLSQGSASVYQYNGTTWVFMQKITDATGALNDHFGQSVSVSGNYIIIGAPDDDNGLSLDFGSVSIYQFNGSAWVLMQKILDANGAIDDRFGYSVSVSGNFVIVGAPEDDGLSLNHGSVSIYQYNGANWVFMIKNTGTTGNDQFGYSVSISGNYAMVGVFGFNSSRGSAIIYKYNGSSWVLNQQLTDPASAPNDFFGISVSISGNYAIVGASADFIGTSLQGSSTIYTRIGAGWQKLQFVTDPNGVQFDSFGIATAIDGATLRFLIGAKDFSNFSGKAVFGKIN
jgi:FG-GAP repeat/LVIVD repeat